MRTLFNIPRKEFFMSLAPGSSLRETTRSEEELRNRILRFLYLKNVQGIEDVYAEVTGGVVTLRGSVPTDRDRRLCVNYCRHVPGVLSVKDELDTDEDIRPAKRRPVSG
jgi:hypothetical protein